MICSELAGSVEAGARTFMVLTRKYVIKSKGRIADETEKSRSTCSVDGEQYRADKTKGEKVAPRRRKPRGEIVPDRELSDVLRKTFRFLQTDMFTILTKGITV